MAPNDYLSIIIIIFQVLHSGNCKQSVLPDVAIFDETTIAAFISYFASQQMRLVSLKLSIVGGLFLTQEKVQLRRFKKVQHKLGNAITFGDNVTPFLKSFEEWHCDHI